MKKSGRRACLLKWRAALAIGAAWIASPPPAAMADPAKALAPIPLQTLAIMAAKGTSASAPLVIRTFKKEAELEIWKQNRDGRFVYIKTFPICRWSGQLGPKTQPGDRQTPEGIYSVAASQMNPNSHYYLSFDTGFPNAYDKAHGASGTAVMVHGTCSSMGCFAMTDKQIGEIYAIARDALKGGQPAFQLQSYPFHMSAKNMALYRTDKNIGFWRQLKEGSDRFESTGEILRTSVVAGRYAFAPSSDAAKERVAKDFHAGEMEKIADLVKGGSAAVTTAYADGGQHAIFAAMLRHGVNLGVVSRPEALAYAAFDVTLVPGRRPRSRAVDPAPLFIVAAEWRPDPSSKRAAPSSATTHATIVKVRLTDVPASLAGVLERKPFGYALKHSPADAALISGAMPLRASAITY